MRDIRGDLQDRANLLERQTVDAQDQFDKLVEQLSQEHASRLADLKSELDAVSAVIESEDRRLGQAPSVVKAQPQLRPSNLPEQAHSHPRLTDTPIPKMRAGSAR